MIHVAAIIAFRGDTKILQWVLAGFAQQRLPSDVDLEVRVGGDGCSPPTLANQPMGSHPRIHFSFFSFPRSGAAMVRNQLLDGIHCDFVIFANSDTRPDENFVAAHVKRLSSLSPGCMVLGSAPYETSPSPTVFDILKEQSPMIFFYDRLKADQLCDYRYTWTLNLSLRHADFVRAGGFAVNLRPYGYEDLDFGFRLMGEKSAIYYDPTAAVLHRHPMSLDDYLNREETLGTVAPNLLGTNPRVFELLFGTRDLAKIADDYRAWTSMDIASHRWTYQRLTDWAHRPGDVLGIEGSQDRDRLLMTLYQLHIPLKRFAFRLGFLRGLDLLEESRWIERSSQALWKTAIS